MTTEDCNNQSEIRILADANAIAQTAAAEFLEAAKEAVREKGSFSVALSGGSTPKALYGLLINNPVLQAMVPWGKIQFFFVTNGMYPRRRRKQFSDGHGSDVRQSPG